MTPNKFPCGRINRRGFLADCGMGFTGLALGSLLQREGFAADSSAGDLTKGLQHFAPRAKTVIWYFMLGGTSHLESFDYKPAINKYAGKTVEESPYKSAVL